MAVVEANPAPNLLLDHGGGVWGAPISLPATTRAPRVPVVVLSLLPGSGEGTQLAPTFWHSPAGLGRAVPGQLPIPAGAGPWQVPPHNVGQH